MKKILLFVVIGAVLLSACGSAAPKGPQITVEGVWGRPSPKVATAGAFYMIIKNAGDEADKLINGSSDACGTVELHESYMMDNGAMGMRPVTGGFIEIPAGGQVELKVGGLHVMCIDKDSAAFVTGATVNLTLKFEKSGEIPVTVEIKEP